jgi:hypothetical protein
MMPFIHGTSVPFNLSENQGLYRIRKKHFPVISYRKNFPESLIFSHGRAQKPAHKFCQKQLRYFSESGLV